MKTANVLIVAAFLGGLFLTFGPRLSLPENISFDSIGYIESLFRRKADLTDTRLLMVHEKVATPINEILAVREAGDFVKANKMSGFLDVDKDDEWAAPLIADVKKTFKLDPPFLVAVRVEKSEIKQIVKAVAWKSGLEDILK
jgi:hypothetical protein